ncbi:MarR family winged helix-turn-helix transcriptional regulator [Pediococcus claussenii]|uniref:Transcriptional regulator, MarR family n=1 Tax=Pediococcus claussenii (strain ATCC BAA-344 / DSM 14800 / JCM 18046 / KCTC 3811 / LMG 21948 / P06) TaxID=701521 RepID=G8PBU9_PEDCP|nr:MarR family transcriptional regulator [Pediococcus claussenii]AEV96007.1 Transcriptional regulator, MarR family [Pediococcus claussenii ATCC BAA-344]ANZ69493.1 hypothetical protein AYR57_03840 [Pediococcus claussenii]ANZ71312.1 hypothetical protein AYR58_03855 [Pediococcus claussenii]KRN20613.1 hypothetical protein IV79_GL000672 [Pediococcus claussenii]
MNTINFSECLYFSSARFNRVIAQISDTQFKKIGLSSTAAFILMKLDEDDMLNPSQIADDLSLDRSTITRFLDKLERDEMITRTPKGRSVQVQLSSAGKRLQPKLKQIWFNLNKTYQTVLGKKFENELRENLNKAFEETK